MFYPAHLNLQNKKCLVVGGGTVAERKVVSMLISGGEVTVVSPDATELLVFLADIGTIQWQKRQLKAGDTKGYFLVCAATDFTTINTAVYTEAHNKNNIRLVNVVDVIPQCTFAAASVVTDGELMISISTSGMSPATSRRIREHFEETLNTSSLYTLGYENGKPVPIENQRLPYPVYLLLEDRKCAVLYQQKTSEIERRVSLLRQCGAIVVHNPMDFDDAFLVISGASVHSGSNAFLQESLEKPDSGDFWTPNLVIDDNLIISISAKDSTDFSKVERLHERFTNQFENNGYGAFINLLGTRRAEVLKAFPTSKMRGDFFEKLIGHVADSPQTCCLRLTNPECSAECLFNWVRCGNLERANAFTSDLLAAHVNK
jgi:siroheme synthase-like protein